MNELYTMIYFPFRWLFKGSQRAVYREIWEIILKMVMKMDKYAALDFLIFWSHCQLLHQFMTISYRIGFLWHFLNHTKRICLHLYYLTLWVSIGLPLLWIRLPSISNANEHTSRAYWMFACSPLHSYLDCYVCARFRKQVIS